MLRRVLRERRRFVSDAGLPVTLQTRELNCAVRAGPLSFSPLRSLRHPISFLGFFAGFAFGSVAFIRSATAARLAWACFASAGDGSSSGSMQLRGRAASALPVSDESSGSRVATATDRCLMLLNSAWLATGWRRRDCQSGWFFLYSAAHRPMFSTRLAVDGWSLVNSAGPPPPPGLPRPAASGRTRRTGRGPTRRGRRSRSRAGRPRVSSSRVNPALPSPAIAAAEPAAVAGVLRAAFLAAGQVARRPAAAAAEQRHVCARHPVLDVAGVDVGVLVGHDGRQLVLVLALLEQLGVDVHVLPAGRERVERLAVHEVELHRASSSNIQDRSSSLLRLGLRAQSVRHAGGRHDPVPDLLDVRGHLRVGDDGLGQLPVELVGLELHLLVGRLAAG